MVNMKDKDRKISTKKESFHQLLDTALLRQVVLKKQISKLTDEGVSSSGVYFECVKEKVSFLYPNLDLSQMEFLKNFHGGKLVDEEAMASLEVTGPALIEDTHNKDVEMDGRWSIVC